MCDDEWGTFQPRAWEYVQNAQEMIGRREPQAAVAYGLGAIACALLEVAEAIRDASKQQRK